MLIEISPLGVVFALHEKPVKLRVSVNLALVFRSVDHFLGIEENDSFLLDRVAKPEIRGHYDDDGFLRFRICVVNERLVQAELPHELAEGRNLSLDFDIPMTGVRFALRPPAAAIGHTNRHAGGGEIIDEADDEVSVLHRVL